MLTISHKTKLSLLASYVEQWKNTAGSRETVATLIVEAHTLGADWDMKFAKIWEYWDALWDNAAEASRLELTASLNAGLLRFHPPRQVLSIIANKELQALLIWVLFYVYAYSFYQNSEYLFRIHPMPIRNVADSL